MSKVREKIKLTSYDELLKVEITDGLKEIDVDKLHDFSNHPFKVSDDEKMEELTESIRERGVLLPILVYYNRINVKSMWKKEIMG